MPICWADDRGSPRQCRRRRRSERQRTGCAGCTARRCWQLPLSSRAASSGRKVPKPDCRPISPPQALPAAATTGLTRPHITGPRLCWLVTRIDPVARTRMRPVMKAFRAVFRLTLMIGLAIEIWGLSTASETSDRKEAQPAAPGLQKLTGDDAKRAEELNKA